MHDHADQCGACKELLAHTASVESDAHLSEQEAVDFAAGSVVSQGIEEHLTECAECRRVVDDLRTFREELDSAGQSEPSRRYTWQFAAAAALFLIAGASLWILRSPVKTPPQLTAALNDGAGAVGMPDSTRQLIAAALASGRLPDGPAGPLETSRGTLRSTGTSTPSFNVVSPTGTREYSDRPSFKWQALAGAESYEVVVFDADLNEIARSGKITGTEWQPAQPLPRMKSLTWQVAAQRRGEKITAPHPPEPSAVFEIISDEAARNIETAKTAAHPSHLALAVLYAQDGMREEAAAEMATLAAGNPDSKLVESLRQSLNSPRSLPPAR